MHHWALKDKISEWSYLQSIMRTLIDSYGPMELVTCPLLRNIIVEILTQNVMYPLINVLTDSHRLNLWIAKLMTNVLKLESDSFHIIAPVHEEKGNDTIPRIYICKPTSVMPEISPQSLAIKDTGEHDNGNSCSDSNFSNFESTLDINTQIYGSLFNRVSITSDEKVEHDDLMSINNTLPKLSKKTKKESINTVFPANSQMKIRAYSNACVSNLFSSNDGESNLDPSTSIDGATMKRSKSADFIRQMPAANALLPLNSLNHNIRFCDKTKKSFIKLKPEVTSGDVEIAEEAVEKEVPPLISDVKIIDTIQQKESGHNSYTLYLIQYNGMFQNMSSQSRYPDLVQQEVNIKRRFREFMALQSRLDDNPAMKNHLKGIKGLSKWLATPFTNLDKRNVAERRVFLESYLQALCKRDAIIQSSELQEFLAYGGDASIAFVKKSVDINVPRIDKFIMRSFKGAMDLFRTALPSTSDASSREPTSYIRDPLYRRHVPEAVVEDSNADDNFQIFLLDYAKRNPDILKHMAVFIKSIETSPAENIHGDYESTSDIFRRSSLLQHSHNLSDQAACNCAETNFSSDGLPEGNLSQLILDLIVETFPESSIVSHLMNFVPTSFLQSIIGTKLEEVNEEKCVSLLHMFHKALWPEIRSLQKPQWDSKLPVVLHEDICKYLETLSRTKHYGKIVNSALGLKNISHAVELLLGSMQNQDMNRCLLFYIFDVVVEAIYPNEQ